MTMESTAREQREERNGWWKRAWGYVRKHQGMTKIGLAIAGGVATPFLVAAVMATVRGAGLEATVWLVSAILMVVTMLSLALWSSRRD